MKFVLDGDQGSFYHWYSLRMDLFLFQTLVCMRISWGACSKYRYSGVIPGGSGVRLRICVINKQHSLSDALILRNMFDLPASYKDAIFLLASASGKNHGCPASVVFCFEELISPWWMCFDSLCFWLFLPYCHFGNVCCRGKPKQAY